MIWGTSAEQPWNNHVKETINEKDVENKLESDELMALKEKQEQESVQDEKSWWEI